MARPYRNTKTGLEGVILVKRGDTEEERQAYREMDPSPYSVFLVPTVDPEKRLRELDFNFSYGSGVRRVPYKEYSRDGYVVHGLKKTTDVKEMRNGRPSLPVGACEKLPITCKPNRRMLPPVNALPTIKNSGGVIETRLPQPHKEPQP